MTFSPELERALTLHSATSARRVHELEVALASFLLPHGPPVARAQLELALAYLTGRAGAAELRSAQQDCWSYVGSLACGCSLAESAASAAFLVCLNGEMAAHTPSALREQVERVLRAGCTESEVIAVLAGRVTPD